MRTLRPDGATGNPPVASCIYPGDMGARKIGRRCGTLLLGVAMGSASYGCQEPGGDGGSAGDESGEAGETPELDGDCAEFPTDDARFTPALAKHFLDLHNAKRAQFCLQPLEWDPKLALVAQGFAEMGAGTLPGHNDLRHEQYADLIGCASDCPQLGENISWQQPWDFWPLETMIDGWLSEVDWAPGCNDGGAHYTQMVWEHSTHLGCGAWIDAEDRAHLVCNYLGFQGPPPAFPAENCSCGGVPPVLGEACD